MDIETHFINLLYGKPRPGLIRALITPKALFSILCTQNPILMSNIQKHIIDTIKQVAQSNLPNPQKQLCIDQALCYLTQFGLNDNQIFPIPTLDTVDGKWLLTHYQIKRIPLTPKWLPIVDQYYAVLFSAKNQQPKLVLMGTTYPANQGFWTTILVDLFPFMNIGGLLSLSGSATISKTFDQYPNLKLIGQSLGGALALSFAKEHTETTLINPALPYSTNSIPLNTTFLHNQGDWVSRQGSIPPDSPVMIACSLEHKPHHLLDHIQSRLQDPAYQLEKISFSDIQSHILIRSTIYWPLRFIGFLLILPVYCLRLIIAYVLQLIL